MDGATASSRRPVLWPDVPEDRWRDWRWQMAHRLTRLDDLIELRPRGMLDGERLASCAERFRLAITPFYAQLIRQHGPESPLWRQVVPSIAELEEHPHLTWDPLGEEKDSPIRGLVHRYSDRILILLTDRCAVYCRFCNRRRLAQGPEGDASKKQLERCLTYLRHHPEVREVILSGGDPLTWPDARLNDFLGQLRRIPSLEVIRIGTRMPVVIPFRVTESLCRVLQEHHPLYVNIHVNHPAELTPEMRTACERLIAAGIPLGSQTVLLRGINNDAAVLQDLFRRLLTFRIKPYCLYHCDPVQGTAHFRTSIAEGQAIMECLMANTSGLAVPSYIVDAPDGEGKIPIMPDYVEEISEGSVILRNLQGRRVQYVDGKAGSKDGGIVSAL